MSRRVGFPRCRNLRRKRGDLRLTADSPCIRYNVSKHRAERESLEPEVSTPAGKDARGSRRRTRPCSADLDGVAAGEDELGSSLDDRASFPGVPGVPGVSGPREPEEDLESLSRRTRRVSGTENGLTSMLRRLRDGEALSPSFRRPKPPSPQLGVSVVGPVLGFEGTERALKRREAGVEEKEARQAGEEEMEGMKEERMKVRVLMQASPAERKGTGGNEEQVVVDRVTYGREVRGP